MADPTRPVVTGYPAAAANGYPYHAAVAPPPRHHYGYSYPNDNAASRAAFFRRMLAIMITFFVIAATIVFIIWLVLRPRLPKFSVDSVSLSNLNLSSPSSTSLSGDWSVGFSVVNPNKKMSISYDDLSAELLYSGVFLSETRIPPFDQSTKNQTALSASFSAKNSYVEDRVVSGINADKAKGTVEFDIRVWARVAFRSGGWRLRRRFLRVLCEDIAVGVSANSSSGKLLGGSRECRVGV